MQRSRPCLIGATLIAAAACLHVEFAAETPAAAAEPAVVAPTNHNDPERERSLLHVPPGFEVQLVASEPDIHKPMNIAFDARGRLWVTDTLEYPFPVPEGQKGRDTVKVLEDFDENGRARKITTFAEGLNIPIGIQPLDDGKTRGCLVYGVPGIQRFLDTDADGKADRHDLLLGGFGHVDTHGMTNNFTRGFDGWVYADHGFKNDSDVRGPDGSEIKMNSGNTYRFRTDGTRVQYFTHGQVNPFGLCFDPLGNLFSADCHSKPQYMLLRGAYYPSFGKPDDGLGFAPEMCSHDHGSTAISGTLYYAAEQFPKEYRGRLFNGNVVTCAVDSDTIEWHGSSPKAVQAPEFVTSDDPWFRPVQIKLGPDGAMWIADFYNKIIGHYEVDLKHPGRDRTSGRIWRVVYKGDAPKAPAPKLPNIAETNPDGQVAMLGDPNLTVRMLATNYIEDAGGESFLVPLRHAVEQSKDPIQRAHALWAVYRLGGLRPKMLSLAADDADRLLRVHVMRILGDMPAWEAAHRDLAVSGLTDADPFVRRCAADALGLHPDPANVRPLLDLVSHTSADDSHLLHVGRIALRDTLSAPGTVAKLPLSNMAEPDRKAIAGVMLAVPGPEAGAFVVGYLKSSQVDRDAAAKFLRHAARYVPEKDVDDLATLAAAKFGDDVELQLELFQSIREGLSQRGVAPGRGVADWGKSLAGRILSPARPDDAPAWVNHPLPGGDGPDSAEPWGYQPRRCADGKEVPLLSSHPRGEQLTGVLRSRAFVIPDSLSFYLAGHNGQPPAKHPIKNLIRLRADGTDEVLAEAPPPRNDVAQKFTWDLKAHASKKGYLEVVDGDTATAYAWIAFGRLEPPVVPMPAAGPADLAKRQETAADIAGWLKLADQSDALQRLAAAPDTGRSARAAAAKALLAIDPARAVKSLAASLDDAGAALPVREAAAAALAPVDSDEARSALVEALRTAPQNLQKSVAMSLAGTKRGGESLLVAVGQGKASARLLQDKPVLDRLRGSKPDGLDERIPQLTKGMATADEALQRLIDQRAAAFRKAQANPAAADPQRGHLVFQKNCIACHQIAGEGAKIGPQLDGIGKRGPDRIVEDLLDPSRNVDLAFRYSVIRLKSGDVLSGLQRREEGQTIVFADSQGKEFTVPKDQIERQTLSQLSLMPGNIADLIPPEEFNHLLAFLLSK